MLDVKKALLVNRKDSVATVLAPVKKGENVEISYDNKTIFKVCVLDDIEMYHKVAVKDMKKNELVCKYGEIIGKATQDIKVGQHVHVNNIESVMVKK